MLATPEMVILLNDQLNEVRAERDNLFTSRRQVLATLSAVQDTLTAAERVMASQNALLGTLLSKLDLDALNSLPPDMRAVAMRYRTVH